VYLSFSGHKSFQECPKQYWHRYVDKTTVPPENCVNSLYGSTIGVLFEQFYMDKLWKRPDCKDELLRRADGVFDRVVREQRKSIVNWSDEKANYHSREELLRDVRTDVEKGLRTIRAHRFLSNEAAAEVELDYDFGRHRVAGRADFLLRRAAPFGDKVLTDGKGSKHGMKYIEKSQVLWYSFLHRARFGHAPDRAGFVLWRFEAEKAVVWVDFTDRDLDTLRDGVLATMDRIEASKTALENLRLPQARQELREERFPAQPSFKCGFCAYLSVCEEGKAKQRQGTGGFSRSSSISLPGSGVRDLSLDD
jgi:PD-(D/E)XK nuclease superfamily